MKKLLYAITAFIGMQSASSFADFRTSYISVEPPEKRVDGSPMEPDEIKHYRIFVETPSGQQESFVMDSEFSAWVPQEAGTYKIQVQVVDKGNRESAKSDVIEYISKPVVIIANPMPPKVRLEENIEILSSEEVGQLVPISSDVAEMPETTEQPDTEEESPETETPKEEIPETPEETPEPVKEEVEETPEPVEESVKGVHKENDNGELNFSAMDYLEVTKDPSGNSWEQSTVSGRTAMKAPSANRPRSDYKKGTSMNYEIHASGGTYNLKFMSWAKDGLSDSAYILLNGKQPKRDPVVVFSGPNKGKWSESREVELSLPEGETNLNIVHREKNFAIERIMMNKK